MYLHYSVVVYKVLERVHIPPGMGGWARRPANTGCMGTLAVAAATAGADLSASPASGDRDSATTWCFLLS
jgi:hypothetical protein